MAVGICKRDEEMIWTLHKTCTEAKIRHIISMTIYTCLDKGMKVERKGVSQGGKRCMVRKWQLY